MYLAAIYKLSLSSLGLLDITQNPEIKQMKEWDRNESWFYSNVDFYSYS
jgi:hypothetical protein